MWAGADLRLSVPDLEYEPASENLGSALEDAVRHDRLEIVKKIGIDPARDDSSALLAECWMCRSPELVRLLIEAGADPNFVERERNPMHSLMRNFEWSLEPMFIGRDPRAAMECIKIAATAAGRWRPKDPYQFRCLRKAITTAPEFSAVGHLRELIDCGAIEQDVFAELMKTPRMEADPAVRCLGCSRPSSVCRHSNATFKGARV